MEGNKRVANAGAGGQRECGQYEVSLGIDEISVGGSRSKMRIRIRKMIRSKSKSRIVKSRLQVLR